MVYLGFDSNIPPGFQNMVLDELSQFSTLVDYRRIGYDGAAAIFDLQKPPSAEAIDGARMQWHRMHPVETPEGCIGMSVAERW